MVIELRLARDEHPGWDYDAAASMFVRLIVTYLGWLDWDSPTCKWKRQRPNSCDGLTPL
jgi:hypothetical protein